MNRADQIIVEWERIGDVSAPLKLNVKRLEAVPVLPPNVRCLNLFGNNITTIESLPDSIVELNVSCNRSLHRLPPLPPRLRKLDCSYTNLRELPDLPLTLEYLCCSNSQLSALPPLPPTLRHIDVAHNHLQHIPTLPITLETLFCYNNQLKTMPYLPPKLIFLLDYNNPFELEDMRWDGRNVCDFQTDTYDQIFKWLNQTGDDNVEERTLVWNAYLEMFDKKLVCLGSNQRFPTYTVIDMSDIH